MFALPALRTPTWLAWVLFVARILIGGLFIFSGSMKMLEPLEEFEASIRQYQFLPELFVAPFAVVLPIAEILSGLFLVFGLFEQYAAAGVSLILLSFIIAIAAVLLRGIPLDNCGCFGSFKFGDSPQETLIRDVILLAFTGLLMFFPSRKFSLDSLL